MSATAFPISNGYAPKQGPKILPLQLDFTDTGTVKRNLLMEEISGAIQNIQSIYVNNRDNVNELRITFDITNQEIVVPAQASGIWPVFATDQISFTATSTAGSTGAGGAGLVNIALMNVPMPLTQWGPVSVTATLALTRGTFTDYSGTIGAGGVSQQAIPANANRKRFIIMNPSSEIESLFVNFTAAASDGGDSIELLPGGSIDSNFGPVTTEEITVVAATLGHKYVAKDM